LEGTINEDSGATIRDDMRVLTTIGVCLEFEDLYNVNKFTQPPTTRDILDAHHYMIS